MKKLVVIIALAVFLTGTAFAEFDPLGYPGSLEGGNLLIDIGAGLNSYGLIESARLRIPPVILTINYCLPIPVPISVGGYASISQYRREWDGGYEVRHTYWAFGTQADWHFGFDMDWMDLYAGMALGYRGRSYYYDGPDDHHKNKNPQRAWFDYGLHGGVHFYVTKNFGFVIEGGFPTWLKAGFALKF